MIKKTNNINIKTTNFINLQNLYKKFYISIYD